MSFGLPFNPTKEQMLPINRTEFGYVQQSNWRNVDRLDEEVVELDSPYSATVKSGTHVYSFVLMGDQNAGKSTFLHSFSHNTDLNYLELSSLLPVLSASFVNTRFLSRTSAIAPIDELPFLDTDLGRSTFAMTTEDFAFFVNERELDPALVLELPRDTVYVVVQFIELGGDHLDQLMQPETACDSTAADIVRRSRALLAESRKVIYFVNGTEFCRCHGARDAKINIGGSNSPKRVQATKCTEPKSLFFDRRIFKLLLKRIEFLNEVLPQSVEVMLNISRCPDSPLSPASIAELYELALDILQKKMAGKWSNFPSFIGTSSSVTLPDALRALLEDIRIALEWRIDFGIKVYGSDHLTSAGSLNPEAICTTLTRMFRRKMIHSQADPSHFVAEHLIRCFKQPCLRLDDNDSFSIWLDRAVFEEYLESLAGNSEAPDTAMLQSFKKVALSMISAGFALRHHARNLSRLWVTIRHPDRDDIHLLNGALETVRETVNPSPSVVIKGHNLIKTDASDEVQMRFPYNTALFAQIDTYFSRNVPGEMWLGLRQRWLESGIDSTLRTAVEGAVETAEDEACKAWISCLGGKLPLLQWLWLIEDCFLARKLLASTGAPHLVQLQLDADQITLASTLKTVLEISPAPPSEKQEIFARVILLVNQ